MIRPATVEDIPALLAMGVYAHQEAPQYRIRQYDQAKAATLFERLIGGDGVVFVSDIKGIVVGALAGGVSEDWFGPDKMAYNLALYVDPDWRQGTHAWRLIAAFKHWAKEMGATVIQMGISTGLHPEETGRLYQAAGFTPIGGMYELEVN